MRTKNKELITTIKQAIETFYDANGYSPSIREIAEMVGYGKSNVQSYLVDMVESGIVFKTDDGYGTEKTAKMSFGLSTVPVMGDVPCGPLSEAEEYIEEYIKLPSFFTGGAKNCYLLRASGDSMIGAGIDDGDLVLIKQQEIAHNGEIIVALVDNQVTLKRYYKEKKVVRLHPENPSMPDILATDLQIQGVAIKVIKDLLFSEEI